MQSSSSRTQALDNRTHCLSVPGTSPGFGETVPKVTSSHLTSTLTGMDSQEPDTRKLNWRLWLTGDTHRSELQNNFSIRSELWWECRIRGGIRESSLQEERTSRDGFGQEVRRQVLDDEAKLEVSRMGTATLERQAGLQRARSARWD